MVGLRSKQGGEQEGTDAEAEHTCEGVHVWVATDVSTEVRILSELRAGHGVPSASIAQWTRPLLDWALEIFFGELVGGVRPRKRRHP